MHCHFSRRLAPAGLVLLLALTPHIGRADEKKGGQDKPTPAEIARSECSAQAGGSKEVILYGLTGGIVGFALARDRYMKDCMASRGYKYIPKKRTDMKRR